MSTSVSKQGMKIYMAFADNTVFPSSFKSL